MNTGYIMGSFRYHLLINWTVASSPLFIIYLEGRLGITILIVWYHKSNGAFIEVKKGTNSEAVKRICLSVQCSDS